MKPKYTKRQIQESIAYWKKQLELGNYKKLDESLVNEGLFDWFGDLFTRKERAQAEKAIKDRKDAKIAATQRVMNILSKAKDYVRDACAERNEHKAGTLVMQAKDCVNEAWKAAGKSGPSRESVAKAAIALAMKLKYAKSNSSYEVLCVDFCNKLNDDLKFYAERRTSDAVIKKSLNGWTGPDWKTSGRKGIPGTGWNYEPARDGWNYDDGY